MGGGRCAALLAVVAALLLLQLGHAYPSVLLSRAAAEHEDVLTDAATAGHNSASLVGELWSLGSGGDDDVAKKAVSGHGSELNEQRRLILQKLKIASDFKRRAQVDGDAISYGVDQKLVSMPPCKCGKENGWGILKDARAQVLADEGEPANQDSDCPCQPSVVGAVAQVLEQKLQQLQMQLGSKTAASLALRKALVSMRLPSMLSQELVQELDSLDGLGPTTVTLNSNSSGDAAAADAPPADGQSGSKAGGVHVTVNNNIPDLQEEYEGNMTSTHPYFDSFQYPASYLSRPEVSTTKASGSPGVNVVVNVHNDIYMQGPPPPALQLCYPHCAHIFRNQGTSALHAAQHPAASAPAEHVPAHVTAGRVRHAQQQHAEKVQRRAADVAASVAAAQAAEGTPREHAKAAGAGAGGRVSGAEKARALAKKIEVAARQAQMVAANSEQGSSSGGGGGGAEERGGAAVPGEGGEAGANGERWEAARRRLVDTALTLERIAREKAQALRRRVAVEEVEGGEGAVAKAPTEELAMEAADGGGRGARGGGGAKRAGPRGAAPVESPLAPILKLPVDQADRVGKVAVPVVTDPAPPPDYRGMLRHAGALGVSDGDARKQLWSYFDDAAARHGGMAGARQARGGGRGGRKGTQGAEDGAGLVQESDATARSDLMAYFDKSAAEHSGRTEERRGGQREAEEGSGKREEGRGASGQKNGKAGRGGAGLVEVTDGAARSDLFNYFDTLSARSQRYTKAEQERAAHGQLKGTRGGVARGDLMHYFDDVAAKSKMYTAEEEKKKTH